MVNNFCHFVCNHHELFSLNVWLTKVKQPWLHMLCGLSFPSLDGNIFQTKAFWENSCKNIYWVHLLIESAVFCHCFKLFEVHYMPSSKDCQSIWQLNVKAEETCELNYRSLQVPWRVLLFASTSWTVKFSYKSFENQMLL